MSDKKKKSKKKSPSKLTYKGLGKYGYPKGFVPPGKRKLTEKDYNTLVTALTGKKGKVLRGTGWEGPYSKQELKDELFDQRGPTWHRTSKQQRKEKDIDLVYDYGSKAQKAKSFRTNRKKKHGGKITYKMTGGQVVDAGYE